MGKLTTGHIVEAALWLGFALFLYIFSFEFDRPIEIYKFGATAWPRAIILLIVVAAVGNLVYHWRFGDAPQGAVGAALDTDSRAGGDASGRSVATYLRLGAILALPFAYAALLQPIGFYTLTPFFIAGVIVLMGERRLGWIVGVSVVSYAAILVLFAKLLYVGLPVGTMRPFYDYSNWLLALLQNN
ncbi:MAG: tripartite tricarboxylate transporter TctB family protein [Hyphomicrobiales bacterium]|nr:tripartite tricarboxylate transporter TctB family protein [Hyphomicrobiales bacterium]